MLNLGRAALRWGRAMRKIFYAFIALQAITAFPETALAAPPAPPPSPTYNWNGLYAGVNLGGAWANVNSNYTLTGLVFDPSGSMSIGGVVGGAQAGYDWQAADWVLGLETDFQGNSQAGSTVVAFFPGSLIPLSDDHSISLPWFGTARGSVGLTAAQPWLLYLTGGLAYGEIAEDNTITGLIAGSHNLVKAGWTLGGGIETPVWTNWTVRLEYLYVDFGHLGDTATTAGGFVGAAISSHLTDNVVRIGLSYHLQ